MAKSGRENMGELLVRSQLALHLLQVDLAKFLGVSDRTVRRWHDGVHLQPSKLHTLVAAVHPKDAVLATRIATAHGRMLEDVLRPLPPARDPDADRRFAKALVLAGAEVAGVAPETMRAALTTVLDGARRAGLTTDEAYALFADTGAK